MNCSFCNEPMADGEPQYYVILGTSDTTSETEEHSSRICEHCWRHYQRELT